MCGRYAITTAPEAILRWFKISGPPPNLPPHYNAAPGQDLNFKLTVRPRTNIKIDETYILSRLSTFEQSLIAEQYGNSVVFNSHLWHGGTKNRSDRPRRALHSYFGRRSRGQQLDQKKYARPATLARLSPAARFILDV